MWPFRKCLVATVGSAILLVQVTIEAKEIRVSSREELVRAIGSATAGTTILIAPGTYQGGITGSSLRGTEADPIVIAGGDPKRPPVIEGGHSGFHLSTPEHVELRDLVFTSGHGNGLNIDDGGNGAAHHVTLRNVVVRDVGPDGNRDGIKLSGLNDFQVLQCEVRRWGKSGSALDMVGCHQGVVENCRFIEAGGHFANGVQAKGGSSDIRIRQCRFENAGGRAVNIGGSTGAAYFRPKTADCESKDITVEDCEFLGGMSAIAFVGVDGALVQHNTIYRPGRWPLRILQENTDPRLVPCRNGKVMKNVIVFRSDEMREAVNVGGNTQPESFKFAGNVWHCIDRPADTRRLVHLPTQEPDASFARDPQLADPAHGDLRILDRQTEDAGRRPSAGSRIRKDSGTQ